MTLILAAEGYMVCTAANGQEALDRLRGKEWPHLILLDLVLPGKDGRQFRAEQQQNPELAAIPVVVFSAAGDGRETAASLGAADYLQKPLAAETLLKAVQQHCR